MFRTETIFVLNSHMVVRFQSLAIDFERLGFSLHKNPTAPMSRPHRHNEVEMTVLNHGQVQYLFGGARVTIPARELCVRWAAIPHQCMDASAGGMQFSLKIPLPWFLQWKLPDRFVSALLHGELLLDHEIDPGCSDWAMFDRWQKLLQMSAAESEQIVLLEAEARLRRMAIRKTIYHRRTGLDSTPSGQLGKVDQMMNFIAAHYTEDIDIDDIARCVSMHPRSAMRLFRKSCGVTLWEYLTLHRVWHAQRLLAASEMKIRQVASASGFNSAGRFYVAFERIVGKLPKEYRSSTRAP